MTTLHDRVLLDTSAVISCPANVVVAQAISVAVSTIALAELAYGLHSGDPLRNAAREQRYHWIADTFDPIPFGAGSARIYGAFCANVRAVDPDPKPRRFDLLIATVAVDLGIPLITRNENDFRGINKALSVIAA